MILSNSNIMLILYENENCFILLTCRYLVHLLIVIIHLLLSVLLYHKVITLNGFHCTLKPPINFVSKHKTQKVVEFDIRHILRNDENFNSGIIFFISTFTSLKQVKTHMLLLYFFNLKS